MLMYNRLFYLRDYNGLSQRYIANMLGVTQPAYSAWENGIKIIPLTHLNTLCNYYNVDMDYMLKLSDSTRNLKVKDNINKKEIGLRLKKIREHFNLSLRSLAKELNTTSSTISAYETGKTCILTAFAYQICKKYNVSMDYVCCRVDDMFTIKKRVTIKN